MSAMAQAEWPAARAGEALLSFLPADAAPPALPPPMPNAVAMDPAERRRWMEATARQLGLEAVAFNTAHAELAGVLGSARTALLLLPGDAEPRFLVLCGGDRKRLRLLGPDHVTRSVAVGEVRAALCKAEEERLGPEIDLLLQHPAVLRAGARVRASLLAERLRNVPVEAGWLLRVPAVGPLRPQVERAGLPGALAQFVAVHAASHGAWILAWLTVGEEALEGRLDGGWLMAGALMLAAFATLRITADRLQALLSLRLGVLMRQRLFEGALALKAQAARGEGIGQFLGRIFEAQAVETLAVSGGLSAATAAFELTVALAILAWGAQAWGLAGLLVLSMVLCAALATWHLRARRRWTDKRRAITHHLIERMVGHRTRLAQEDKRRWHEEEDQGLRAYAAESSRFDSTTVWLGSVLPRLWLLAATVGLGWAFSTGTSTQVLAVTLGAMLLAFDSFRHLVQGLPAVAGALTAWEEAAPLLQAAAAVPVAAPGQAVARVQAGEAFTAESNLEARDLCFSTQVAGRSVLREVSLHIRAGEHVLLEGPSGGGKSTLAAMLAGLRTPDHGLLLFDGLDLATLGEVAWRRRVALAAQFHENHVISETFAFNLLMGRAWPPAADDLDRAETLCREVGLGGLIDRMPSGLDQMVGESGWQLSHGERSRLYLVRALLQDADLVVLDESLAALDPQTLQSTLDCALRRAPSLLVVAHP